MHLVFYAMYKLDQTLSCRVCVLCKIKFSPSQIDSRHNSMKYKIETKHKARKRKKTRAATRNFEVKKKISTPFQELIHQLI